MASKGPCVHPTMNARAFTASKTNPPLRNFGEGARRDPRSGAQSLRKACFGSNELRCADDAQLIRAIAAVRRERLSDWPLCQMIHSTQWPLTVEHVLELDLAGTGFGRAIVTSRLSVNARRVFNRHTSRRQSLGYSTACPQEYLELRSLNSVGPRAKSDQRIQEMKIG
jgi:non-ribosomal peptide synthetase component F